MAGIGLGGMLAGLGAGLGQYADYALKQKQQQAQELYQQVQLAMLRSKLQQEQGDQAIASTPFDLGAPGAGGGVGGGFGGGAPTPSMGQPMSAAPGLPSAIPSQIGGGGAIGGPRGIGIPGAPSILSGAPAAPIESLPTTMQMPDASAYAGLSGPGAPTGGPSPPPTTNAQQVPGPNDAILGGRSLDNPLAAGQPQPGDAKFGGGTQVAQAGQPQDLTGGMAAPGGGASGTAPIEPPPKPQLYNLGEVAQRLQQQVATMGGSAAFKRQWVNGGLSAAKAANEAAMAQYRADLEAARFKQTQQNQQSEQAVRGMHVFRDPQGNQHWLRSGDPIPTGWKEGSGGSAFGNLSDMPSAIVLPEKLWPGAPDKPPTGLKDAAGNPVTLDPGVYSAALAYAKSGGSIKPPFSLWGNNPLALKFNQALPVAEQALGIAPSKLADVGAAYGGERAAATTVGHVTGSTAQGAQEIGMFVPLITSTAAKIDLSQFPTINTIANAVRKGTGDPNIIALNSYIQSAKNAYVLVMARSGRPTVWANKRSDELLSPSMGVDQIPAALEAMQNEAKVAQAGARAATQEVTGQGPSVAPPGQPQGSAPAAAQPPMPNAKQAPDGNWYVPDPDRPGKYLRVDQ